MGIDSNCCAKGDECNPDTHLPYVPLLQKCGKYLTVLAFVSWSEAQVQSWLSQCGFSSKHVNVFAEHEITGKALLEIEEHHLYQWGIPGKPNTSSFL